VISGSSPGRRLVAVFALGVVFLGVASVIKPDPRSATATGGNSFTVEPGPQSGTNSGRGSGAIGAGKRPSQRAASSAANRPPADDVVAQRLSAKAHSQGLTLLGQLRGKQYRVLAYAAAEGGAVYSVFTLDGAPLAADLQADEVYRTFPELDLTTLRDAPGSDALMLADPQE
jgi:hypothetical protein